MLVDHMVERLAQNHGKRIGTIPRDVLDRLTAYEWSGIWRMFSSAQSWTGATDMLLAVIEPADLHFYPVSPFRRVAAHTEIEALQLLEHAKPCVVVVDWDMAGINSAAICEAAHAQAGVLVTTAVPERAPAALKAGCHSVLLKPVTPSLVATRVGRLVATLSNGGSSASSRSRSIGTNLSWPDMACPCCAAHGVTSFEFLSHRRAWYACLACDHVWIGRRREVR